MRFKDKYKTKDEADPDKKEISNEAYAIGELLEEIKQMLFSMRFK